MVIQYTIEKATIVAWLNRQKIMLAADWYFTKFLNLKMLYRNIKYTLIYLYNKPITTW